MVYKYSDELASKAFAFFVIEFSMLTRKPIIRAFEKQKSTKKCDELMKN